MVGVRRMSGALLEQLVAALGCPCAPSLEPVPHHSHGRVSHTTAVARTGLQWEFCSPGSHRAEPLGPFQSLVFAAAKLELMMH